MTDSNRRENLQELEGIRGRLRDLGYLDNPLTGCKIGPKRANKHAILVHVQPLRRVIANVLRVVYIIAIDVRVAFVRRSILITVAVVGVASVRRPILITVRHTRVGITREAVSVAIFLSVTAHAVPGHDVALGIGCARRGRDGPDAVEARAQLGSIR